MRATDPIPSTYEPPTHEREFFASQEFVEYNDGAVNLLFAGQGDRIVWGKHKYADPEISPTDRIIVRTKSGNCYVLGDQLVINVRHKTVHDLDDIKEPLPDITIGEQWQVPGYMITSDVESVELQWKITAPGTGMGRMIDRPNPFEKAEKLIGAANEHLHNIGRR